MLSPSHCQHITKACSLYVCTFKYHNIHPSSDLVIVFPALIDHHNVFWYVYSVSLLCMPEMAHEWLNKVFYSILFYFSIHWEWWSTCCQSYGRNIPCYWLSRSWQNQQHGLCGVQLLVFFCCSVPVMLLGTPGISGCRSQHVPVESSSLLHHSIYLRFICFPWWSIDELENLHADRITVCFEPW